MVKFKDTVKLLQLTQKLTQEERDELLTYISQLENTIVTVQSLNEKITNSIKPIINHGRD